jgi:DNA-binding transcriptional MerR regulator
MTMTRLRIGRLAAQTGASAATVRYYEEIGLLRPADRQPSGQRTYGEEDVRRLAFIRRCRDFGFSIEQVRSLIGLVEDSGRSCIDAREIAQTHLSAIRTKIAALKALERTLFGLVISCDTSCGGGRGPDCVIFNDLSKVTMKTA